MNDINSNENEENEIITWINLKTYLQKYMIYIKIALIIFTILFIIYIHNSNENQSQSGGGKFSMMTQLAKGMKDKGSKAVKTTSPLSGAFSMMFSFINSLFMIFGIVLILILIPTIPIMVFLVISYYICRRKLWDIRTM
jgi:hypothetical protein